MNAFAVKRLLVPVLASLVGAQGVPGLAQAPVDGRPLPPDFSTHALPYPAPGATLFPAPAAADQRLTDGRGRIGSERFDPLDSNRALGAGNSNLPQPITSTALPNLLSAVALPDSGKIVLEVERDNIPADGNTMVQMKLRLFDRDGKPWTQGTEVIIKTTRGRLRLPDASPVDAPRNELRVAVRNGEAQLFLITTHEPGDALLYAQSGNVVVEGKVTMLPDKRPMIAVGVLEGAFNLRRLDASKLSQPRTNDAFELEIRRIQPFGQSNDGKTDFGARSAFFLKGVVKGDYLLTLAYDSEKRVRDRVFRDIQPDQFYPIYGDSSLRGFDAQTSQRLYVRVDKEKSFFLYGDFSTASTTSARQLGNYSRTITGIKEHYEDEFIAANAWATRDNVRRIVDEQPSRGISGPYGLSSTQGISGSERVEIVTRDRNQPSVILKTVPMVRFSDYEFEPFSGNIIFKSPIPSTDENFNPNSVRVTYEVEQGGPKFWLGGVDGQWKITPDIEVGGSYVTDKNPTDPYELKSVNATVRLGENTYVVGEFARSERELLGALGRGDGKRLELRHKSERFEGRAYYGETDTRFSNISSQLNGGREEAGVIGTLRIDEKWALRVDGTRSEDKVSLARRESAKAELRYKMDETWTFGMGVRSVRNEGGAVNAASAPGVSTIPSQLGFQQTQISAPLTAAAPGQVISYEALALSATMQLTDRSRLLAEYEQDVARASRNRITVGGDYRIDEQYRLYGRAEFANGLGGQNGLAIPDSRQTALVAGVSGNYMKGGELFNEFRLRDAISGRDAMNATGLRNTITYAEGIRFNVGAEYLKAVSGNVSSATALTGGVELTYDPRWRATGRLEWRQDANYDNWLSTLGYTAKMSREWSLLMRNQLVVSDARNTTVGSRIQERFQVGAAYRQIDTNRINALGLYELRYEKTEPAAGATGSYERTAHVFSTHADYHPSRPVWYTGRIAAKLVDEKFEGGLSSKYNAFLVGARWIYDITEKWNVGAQANVMFSPQGSTRQSAVGVEAGYLIRQNLWITAGYNWTGFSDRDLQGAGYTNRGIYVRLRFKFDETLFRGDDPTVNKSLVPGLTKP